MEQIKLKNGITYELVTGGVMDLGNGKIRITILPAEKTFSEIENDFETEENTQRLEIVNSIEEIMDVKKDYTCLESVKKQKDYIIGTEEYENTDGEKDFKNVTDTVYAIVLSKPGLREQIKNIQETVDFLVVSALEV